MRLADQQDADGHHGGGARGHGAVHEDHVVFADVFGETQVVQLRWDRDATVVSVSVKRRSRDHCCGLTDVTTDLQAV